jgi:hypothetical protein
MLLYCFAGYYASSQIDIFSPIRGYAEEMRCLRFSLFEIIHAAFFFRPSLRCHIACRPSTAVLPDAVVVLSRQKRQVSDDIAAL